MTPKTNSKRHIAHALIKDLMKGTYDSRYIIDIVVIDKNLGPKDSNLNTYVVSTLRDWFDKLLNDYLGPANDNSWEMDVKTIVQILNISCLGINVDDMTFHSGLTMLLNNGDPVLIDDTTINLDLIDDELLKEELNKVLEIIVALKNIVDGEGV